MKPQDIDLIHYKESILNNLSNIRKLSSDSYNKAQEDLSKGLFTAATTFVTLILAFASSLQGLLGDYSWIVVICILFFTISIIPWMIEKIVISATYGKSLTLGATLSDIARNEAWDANSLSILDKTCAQLLCSKRTSLIPIILQIVFFMIGTLFAVISIMIVLL